MPLKGLQVHIHVDLIRGQKKIKQTEGRKNHVLVCPESGEGTFQSHIVSVVTGLCPLFIQLFVSQDLCSFVVHHIAEVS